MILAKYVKDGYKTNTFHSFDEIKKLEVKQSHGLNSLFCPFETSCTAMFGKMSLSYIFFGALTVIEC